MFALLPNQVSPGRTLIIKHSAVPLNKQVQDFFTFTVSAYPKVSDNQQQNIEWISNLRFISLIAVIMLHASAVLLSLYGKVKFTDWLTADIFNALVRFAVPVFVMITGALLLHREYELTDFLKKRLGRVVTPFLFWSLVYIAYSWYNEEFAFTDDAWANVKLVLHQLKYGSSYHLWYVYMLIGLYLFIPVISKFVRNATEKEVLYFLLVWLVVMFFNQSWLSRFKPQIELRYFEGYVGYLVLGHYLAFKEFNFKIVANWMFALFVLSITVITAGTYLLTNQSGNISTTFYEPVSPFVLCLSAGLFLLVRSANIVLPVIIAKTRDFAGTYAYGVYLCHALFLYLLEDLGLSYKFCTPLFSIPLTAIGCLILSVLLTYVLNKIPVIGKYIGG